MKPLGKTGIAFAAIVLCSLIYSNRSVAQQPVEAPSIKGLTTLEADALYYEAVRARNKGDIAEAERLLEQVIKLKPDAAGAYYDLSRLSLPNKPDKATVYIKKAIDIDGTNKWYKDQYAQILAFGNKYEDAAVIYEKLAKDERHNEEYILKSSLLYQRAGNFKKSLETIDKLIEKTGNDEEILMQKYQLCLKMNDVECATNVVQTLIEQDPSNGRYYSLLAEVYDNNQQPNKALEILQQAEKLFPDDPGVQLSIAEHYRKKKDSVNYNYYVKKALVNKGFDADMQMALLVNYMQELGDNEERKKEALKIAEQIAAERADNAQVLALYGDILSINDQRDKAQEQYKKALERDPSQFAVWRNLLFNYTDRMNADSLIVYSEKAMRLFPNQSLVHMLNGIGHNNKRDFAKAIKAFNRAIDLQPEEDGQQLADIYMYLGDAYNSTKQYALSDSSFEKALKLSPDNASVLNNYAYYLSERNARLEDAEKMSKRSLELRPEEGTFLDTYGWILYKQGKYDKAKDYIQKAIDQDKENADGTLWDHLGDITYKQGNKDKAVEYWKKAKEKGADNEQLDKKIQDRKLYE